ncbi:hypothetical protein WKI72_20215 [Candidatus Erwinia dacicola]|uniref:Uncharacterized protein n=1 Tax=Candidatus Erwinia dacicola TaxID=252393 RepID=A0A1E7Z1E4_9GAMM|nr:hypothetical protein [Candidatus Erwinia dacicola]OFC62616.1 hypothetical protein BBW68_08910 [Candidatus Erwinia dacicola]
MSDRLKTFRNCAIGGIIFSTVTFMISGIFVENQFERIANGIELIAGVVVVCGIVWLYSLKHQYPESFKKADKAPCSRLTPPKCEPEQKILSAVEKAKNAKLWGGKK